MSGIITQPDYYYVNWYFYTHAHMMIFVHGSFTPDSFRMKYFLTQINWKVLPPPNSHIGHTTIDSYYTVFNKWKLPFVIHAELHQVNI